MKRIIFCLMAILFSTTIKAQDNDVVAFGEEEIGDTTRYFLGFQLLPSASEPTRFYEIEKIAEGKFNYKEISIDNFVYQMKGLIKSKANAKGEDLFLKHKIISNGGDENIVDKLWKLRYKEFPYETQFRDDITGWSNNTDCPDIPSKEQYQILSEYGINRIQDFCYGYDMYRLLRDMNNPDWRVKYVNCAGSQENSNSNDPNNNTTSQEDQSTFVD